MKSVVAEALDDVLSAFGKEAHFAMVFMLENRYGIKVKDPGFSMIDLRRGLVELLGDGADILVYRMEEYMLQNSVGPEIKG
jgi:hypothetical protein